HPLPSIHPLAFPRPIRCRPFIRWHSLAPSHVLFFIANRARFGIFRSTVGWREQAHANQKPFPERLWCSQNVRGIGAVAADLRPLTCRLPAFDHF
ncbi:MAG: hypothetical protein JXR37_31300, partial [Kiritimatiellae bacterium]|nr:hypothetical protein [Kiritimatiellia bacterium]